MFTLLAIFAVGLGSVGIVMAAFRLTGRKAPRWILPATAGICMASYAIWNEYSWFQRTADRLPEGVVVAETQTTSAAWQPWTYIVPRINRFMAVDTRALKRNDDLPGYVLVEVLFVERFEDAKIARQMVDCNTGRRADVVPAEGFDEQGLPANAQWYDLDPDSGLLRAACAES